MSEEEAKKALFELNYEYMSHTPKERLELYEKYQESRRKIKEALSNFVLEQKQMETQNKIIR